MAGNAEVEFRDFALRCGPRLGRTAYLLTGDRGDAEDLVQTALARTWGAWRRLEDIGKAEAYARVVLLRLAQRRWHRRGRARPAAPERPVADTADTADTVALAETVRVALRTLPPDQRAVLVLRYYEQRSETEIAELLRCSPGTVKSRASRGLRRLRESGLLDDEPLEATSDQEVRDGYPS